MERPRLADTRHLFFKSLTEGMDTTTSTGMLLFGIFGSLAEFERNLIRERTVIGLSAARVRGRNGGRPHAILAKQIEMAKTMLADPSRSVKEEADVLNVARSTLYSYLKAERMNSAK